MQFNDYPTQGWAEEFAPRYQIRIGDVAGFVTAEGRYALATGPFSTQGEAEARRSELLRWGRISGDASVIGASRYQGQFWPAVRQTASAQVAAAAPVPAPPTQPQISTNDAQDGYWIQIEAHATLRAAEEFASRFQSSIGELAGFRIPGGWYALALGPFATPAEAERRRTELIAARQIREDTYITDNATYGQQFWPIRSQEAPTPVPTEAPVAIAPVVEAPGAADDEHGTFWVQFADFAAQGLAEDFAPRNEIRIGDVAGFVTAEGRYALVTGPFSTRGEAEARRSELLRWGRINGDSSVIDASRYQGQFWPAGRAVLAPAPAPRVVSPGTDVTMDSIAAIMVPGSVATSLTQIRGAESFVLQQSCEVAGGPFNGGQQIDILCLVDRDPLFQDPLITRYLYRFTALSQAGQASLAILGLRVNQMVPARGTSLAGFSQSQALTVTRVGNVMTASQDQSPALVITVLGETASAPDPARPAAGLKSVHKAQRDASRNKALSFEGT